MLNLSIMPLDLEHIDEVCEDIIEQQRTGATTHAMMIMYFTPEGTPPQKKAEYFCQKYDKYRERLDRAGAKHGVLVQSTLGHITPPLHRTRFKPSSAFPRESRSAAPAVPWTTASANTSRSKCTPWQSITPPAL